MSDIPETDERPEITVQKLRIIRDHVEHAGDGPSARTLNNALGLIANLTADRDRHRNAADELAERLAMTNQNHNPGDGRTASEIRADAYAAVSGRVASRD
jgi:hypothetical protein